MTKPNPHARRCAARSKRTGKRCGRHVAPGYDHCRHHAGTTPARAKATAGERIAQLIDPSISALAKALRSNDSRISAPTGLRVLQLAREHGLLDGPAKVAADELSPLERRRQLECLDDAELAAYGTAIESIDRFTAVIAERLAAQPAVPALPPVPLVLDVPVMTPNVTPSGAL